jgi:hypothetical protein
MRISVLKLLIPIAAGLVLQSRTVMAEGPTPSADAVASTVAGWNEFVESLRTLPSRLLAKLPESMRNDPQVQQEVGRLALEALASSTLDAIASDGDHPTFVAQINQTLNVGQPNADTVYRLARIRPGGSYRLRGRRGTARIVKLGQIGGSGRRAQVAAGRYPGGFQRRTRAVDPGATCGISAAAALVTSSSSRIEPRGERVAG